MHPESPVVPLDPLLTARPIGTLTAPNTVYRKAPSAHHMHILRSRLEASGKCLGRGGICGLRFCSLETVPPLQMRPPQSDGGVDDPAPDISGRGKGGGSRLE